jgi:hypothetical protein
MGAVGVHGSSNNPYGASSVPGIQGISNNGPGVAGHGRFGGSFSGTSAPLVLHPATTLGPPKADDHLAGELFVDSRGDLYLCTRAGTPGTWMRVALTAP